MKKELSILGIRGIPAQHGGFETFAEKLALYLVNNQWIVTVYCQEDKDHPGGESFWNGIKLVHIPIKQSGALGTIFFDWKSILHSSRRPGVDLTLGYNTALFNIIQKIFKKKNIINMDGIEWQRSKWNKFARAWFWLNERLAYHLGDHLIADHPEIKNHLIKGSIKGKRITTIPYGSDEIFNANPEYLKDLGLTAGEFSIIIARPEPENSILEIVRAFSRTARNHSLVVLGNYEPRLNPYHKLIIESASDEVLFPGAIYDKDFVNALRVYSRYYLHGHTVGGTNPSLVEALGSGSPIIAHDNIFNKWVARDAALYFSNMDDCANIFDSHLNNMDLINRLKIHSKRRHQEIFLWNGILQAYDEILTDIYPKRKDLS